MRTEVVIRFNEFTVPTTLALTYEGGSLVNTQATGGFQGLAQAIRALGYKITQEPEAAAAIAKAWRDSFNTEDETNE